MRDNLVLIGMMGAGKSAIGAELARRLSVPHVDADTEIERAAAMTIPEIFARDGEDFFRARESQVLARILSRGPRVVSTGGGAWMRAENRAVIREHGLALWLDVDAETLWDRVRARAGRPLLLTDDPRGTLERLLAQRNPVYARADLTVRSGPRDSVEATTARVIEALRSQRPAFLEDAE
ncbi:MAG: shikimate kinase [Paracoccus sp. (in: a-proteobacteria)]|uniref:shikimate kinase n=1 Tax=Paracoccus sp. TaxID=267 RepID=UPI0026E04F4F|nr:shikimate kinase [Paracoccus sp. (in: a-proteobacteria)]MDO5622349.1 shikimate kinase [Paracoccus sp. (in: a-proteobacteria)]